MTVLQLFSGRKCKTNKEIIEQIILEKYNQYYRLAYSYTHNEADASDIVQNGAYKALRSCHTLKELEFASTWVYRIMINECFSYTRISQHISYENMLDEKGIELGLAEDTYTNIDLQKAMDTLSDKDKAIITLKYFEDKTFEEIAVILDENINTVKSRLYRGLKKLRDVLSDKVSESTHCMLGERAGDCK